MTPPDSVPGSEVLATLPADADHRRVLDALLARGWARGGVGDWAFVLRSTDGALAARISPFDPVGPYTAAFYREAASTGRVPALWAHRRLAGGGDLQLLEWLEPVPPGEAARFHTAADDPDLVVARIPEMERRFLTEIPLGASGPWDPAERAAVREGLLAADARAAPGGHTTDGGTGPAAPARAGAPRPVTGPRHLH